MRGASACPDSQSLQRFLLGQCTPQQAESLERHLDQCDRCLSTLHSLRTEDSLVEAIRSQDGAGKETDSPALRCLTERLKRLRQAGGDSEQTSAADAPACAVATLPPAPAADGPPRPPDKDTVALYDFLAPAGGPGELGRLGPYRVRRVLGAGGMGVVFEAYDPDLERPVALKAMLPALALSLSAKQRFLREARAAAALKHDHIVTIYHVGEDRGVPFLAMEFLEGEALDRRLARQGRLPLAEVLRIGRELAEGLAAAHQRGLIHRDIKPGNVWLEAPEGRVKILDFGLARAEGDSAHLTQFGTLIGTPAFMAPEQVDGRAVDARCDLFSLGCVLYRLATGRLPFEGRDSVSTLMAVSTINPTPPAELSPDLPPGLGALIMRLLAKRPDDRPASALAVAQSLHAIEQEPVPSPAGRRAPPRASAALARFPRRTWLPVAAAVLVGLLGLGGWWFGPALVRFASDEGELVIEIDDPQVQAVVDQAGVTIRDRESGRSYQLKPGRHSLKSGDYEIEVTDVGGGMRLFTREFTIARGGRTPVRVTLDTKALADRAAAKVVTGGEAGPASGPQTVSWAAKEPKHVFADPAHALTDVIDFRDLAGADWEDFHAWLAGLGTDFRLALLTSRSDAGRPLLNAVAVREREPRPVRFYPGMPWAEGGRIWDRMCQEHFRAALTCDCTRQGQLVTSQLWVQDEGNWSQWFGPLPSVMNSINDDAQQHHRRPVFLHAPAPGGDGVYFRADDDDARGRKWKISYTLSPAELLSAVTACCGEGWRPDVLAPYEDGGQLRFMLVVVDNHDNVDWRFRMDMSLQDYRAESAEQKRQGLFPLALSSYKDAAGARFAAIWVRYQIPPRSPDARGGSGKGS